MPGRFRPVVVVLGFLAIGTAVGAALKPIRWRTQVVFLHAIGRIPDIDTRHLLAYMMPGSSQMLGALIVTRNPFEVIRNARTSSEDIRRGGAQFNTEGCAHCPRIGRQRRVGRSVAHHRQVQEWPERLGCVSNHPIRRSRLGNAAA